MELLVFAVADHQLAFRVPQHEGFGNIFNGVLQTHFRCFIHLVELFLAGDIKHNANEMRFRVLVAGCQSRPGPQPHPGSVFMSHAEFMVKYLGTTCQQILCEVIELCIIRMDAF